MSTPLAMGPGVGFELDRKVDFCTAGAAFSKGDVVAVTAQSTATGPMKTITAPTTQSIRYGVHGVVMDNCASGEQVLVCFKGHVQAYTSSASGTQPITQYSIFNVLTTKTLNVDGPTSLPRVIVARGLEDTGGSAASSTRALRWVMFDGTQTGLDFGSNGAANLNAGVATSAASAAYASSSTISTFATTTPGTDDINVSLPAGYLSVANKTILIRASGTWDATGTPTLTLAPYLDTAGPTAGTQVALHSLVGTLTALTGQLWCAEWQVTCKTAGATGTVYTSVTSAKIASATSSDVGIPVTSAAVDLTAALFVKIRPTWSASSASNTTTLNSLSVQRLTS